MGRLLSALLLLLLASGPAAAASVSFAKCYGHQADKIVLYYASKEACERGDDALNSKVLGGAGGALAGCWDHYTVGIPYYIGRAQCENGNTAFNAKLLAPAHLRGFDGCEASTNFQGRFFATFSTQADCDAALALLNTWLAGNADPVSQPLVSVAHGRRLRGGARSPAPAIDWSQA
jgi:hypothetical protein